MLQAALGWAGVKHEEIHAVVVDRHLTWKIKGDGKIFLDNVEEAVGGQPKPIKDWARVGKWFDKSRKTPSTITPSGNVYPIRSGSLVEEEEFEEDYTNTFGMDYVSRRRFEALTKDGCAQCTGDITWKDRDTIVWVDAESPCCMDCADYLTGKMEAH